MSLKLEELVGKSITEAQFDEAAGKKDACYRKVKARYDVWPSAYASGALVKCRKVGAKNWGNKSKKESVNENTERAVKDMINRRVVKKGQNNKDRVRAIGQWLDDHSHEVSATYNDNWIRRIKMGRGGQVQDWWGDTMTMIKNRLGESLNESGMELNKIRDAIKMFQKKIEKQGRVTNARDEEHLSNLIKLYNQMGGKGIKESLSEDVSPKGWNMSKKYIKFIEREVKNLKKYHMQQNDEDFVEVANYIQLQLKQMLKDLNESKVNESGLAFAVILRNLAKHAAKKRMYDKMKKKKRESVNEERGSCWVGYKQVGMKDKGGKQVPNCVKEIIEIFYEENGEGHGYTFEHIKDLSLNEAEYQGRKVKLGKIMQGDQKKFKVYVKNPKGNVVKVNFGQGGKAKGGTMKIRKSNPKARASFRARHNCDNPGPRHKARYWSCRKW